MSDFKVSKGGGFTSFDGMSWPRPGTRLQEAHHALVHGDATRQDSLLAASVLAAYQQLVSAPRRKREAVVRALRKAMKGGANGA